MTEKKYIITESQVEEAMEATDMSFVANILRSLKPVELMSQEQADAEYLKSRTRAPVITCAGGGPLAPIGSTILEN